LPLVGSPLVIDGWTQPGFAGRPIIELKGGPFVFTGLGFYSHSNVVRGLIINDVPGYAISLESGSSSNLLVGNWIGLDATGKSNRWNGTGIGIFYGGTNNVIGGTNAQSRNVIAASFYNGVEIRGSGNVVQGNYIGTDVDGTNGLGNGYTTNGTGNYAAGVWVGQFDFRECARHSAYYGQDEFCIGQHHWPRDRRDGAVVERVKATERNLCEPVRR
jgi:hypothetical protein